MNSSATLTAVTLLAAAALGVAIGTQGCTTTSSTDTDTDGGSQTSSSGTSGTSGSSGTSGTSGSPESSTDTCAGDPGRKDVLVSQDCQTCLDTSCCTQLTACFSIGTADTDAGTKQDCNTYVDCIDTCATDADPDGCYADCDNLAETGVAQAYTDIETCGRSSCAAACQFETPDGG